MITSAVAAGASSSEFLPVGMALHRAATNVIHIASEAVNPRATTEADADHVATVTRSENQYRTKVEAVHVLLWTGTGS